MALEFKLNPSVGDFYDDSVGTIWRCTSASPVKWVKETGRYLASINKTINANTIVDVFIYDTTKDDDGGAWVDKANWQSWYHETLNTATRGATRAFPKVCAVIAEATKVTIYDLTDSTCPMWMVVDASTNVTWLNVTNSSNPITSVYAKNGEVYITKGGTTNPSYSGLAYMRFIDDELWKQTSDNTNSGICTKNISERHDSFRLFGSYLPHIVNSYINGIAVTSDGNMNNTVACLTADSMVMLSDGREIPITEVKPDMYVKTFEGENKVLNFFEQGEKEVIELVFDNGAILKCTKDHLIKTTDGWVEADKLNTSHEVIGYA